MKAFLARLFSVGVVVSLFAASGCGGGTGDVTGSVKYKGKALDGGQIQFKGSNGKTASADINPDGTYTVTGVPTGTVKVAVSYVDPKVVEHFKALSAGGRGESKTPPPKGEPSQFDKVPQKYGDFDGSGLTVEVKTGPNKHDVDLKD